MGDRRHRRHLEAGWVIEFDVVPQDDAGLSLGDLVGHLRREMCDCIRFQRGFVWSAIDCRLDFLKGPVPPGLSRAPKFFPVRE